MYNGAKGWSPQSGSLLWSTKLNLSRQKFSTTSLNWTTSFNQDHYTQLLVLTAYLTNVEDNAGKAKAYTLIQNDLPDSKEPYPETRHRPRINENENKRMICHHSGIRRKANHNVGFANAQKLT